MGELSIKIKIGEREYPMRVSASEEERIRMAGKLINEKMKTFRETFGIDDRQDLLAMVAFDSMVERLKAESAQLDISDNFISKIDMLNNLLDTTILVK